tara:strand:- start:116 stop:508 length:393 start_codon:yes stop_codon:yes gene_type:complete
VGSSYISKGTSTPSSPDSNAADSLARGCLDHRRGSKLGASTEMSSTSDSASWYWLFGCALFDLNKLLLFFCFSSFFLSSSGPKAGTRLNRLLFGDAFVEIIEFRRLGGADFVFKRLALELLFVLGFDSLF